MPVVKEVQGGGQIFFCPGCKSPHQLNAPWGTPRWQYNGNAGKPTFSPSVMVIYRLIPEEGLKEEICHSFIRDGQIQFLNDCTHSLKGQTVPLSEWPYGPGQYGGIVD